MAGSAAIPFTFEQALRDKGYRVSFHPSSSGHDYAALGARR